MNIGAGIEQERFRRSDLGEHEYKPEGCDEPHYGYPFGKREQRVVPKQVHEGPYSPKHGRIGEAGHQ